MERADLKESGQSVHTYQRCMKVVKTDPTFEEAKMLRGHTFLSGLDDSQSP